MIGPPFDSGALVIYPRKLTIPFINYQSSPFFL